MRNILLAAGMAGVFVAVQACGGDDKHPQVIGDSGNNQGGKGNTSRSGSGGKQDSSDAGAGGEIEQAPNGPVVKIISPSPSKTPDDGVLIEETVKVLCTVTESTAAGASAIDPMTIKLALLDAEGNELETKSGAAANTEGQYSTDFVLTTAPSGVVTFVCSAQDKEKLSGKDEVSTFLDHGPTITVVTPKPKSAFPLKGGFNVEFDVDPTRLTADDTGADVDKVVFLFDGKEFPVDEVSPGKYQTSLQLDDAETFPVTPSGAITISATNLREPKPVTAEESYNVTIDGAGPVIKIESPKDKDVWGGPHTLVFTVDDAGSGVDEKSVNVALWPKAPPVYFDKDNGWTHTGNRYTYSFDTKAIEPHAKTQTTFNVLASDVVGNTTPIGQSVTFYLDNVPPQIDLDPLNVRMIAAGKCSNSFDPVGTAAVDDQQGVLGDAVLTSFDWFRAFVRERTNEEPGQTLFFHSGTDQTSVRLYVQGDPANAPTKLLINKNPGTDNTCDDIGGVDSQDPPSFNALRPINANQSVGTIWNQQDAAKIPVVTNQCTLSADAAPERLCPTHSSDMWYAPFDPELKEPHVYVAGTPNPADVSCAGIDLSFLSNDQPDGWVCAAARVVDNAGNVGISPPIRLCVTRNENNPPACRISSTEPPTCTDGCTPPVRGGGMFLKL